MDEREELNRRAGEAETVRRERAEPELDKHKIREMADMVLTSVEEEFAELRAQRDELLAACKATRAYLSIDGTYGKLRPDMALTALNLVVAAIKRAEGD